ncbi:MAG: hypothetical protein JXD19_11635 [Deltaproteobacteria bacterium]|nr:hypothetical protein [Deltaproteobacteria bacterium]
MDNLLLENVEYKIQKTSLGVWRRFLYTTGDRFAEFKTTTTWFGFPLLHYTRGICPETGKRVVARGIVAVGRLAVGILAIGQASFGIVAIGQLAVSFLFGLGQGVIGWIVLGQVAIGVKLGIGQLATGFTAIGQLGIGRYVLGQAAFGEHVWCSRRADPEAVKYFNALLERAHEFFANFVG